MATRALKKLESLLSAFRLAHRNQLRSEDKIIGEQLSSVRKLIRSAKRLPAQHYNPFRECKIDPLERHTRDFLAHVLNASFAPALQIRALQLLIDEAANGSANAKKKVLDFKRHWAQSGFDVEIEVGMSEARPDIVLRGKNFLVALELKRHIGFETIVDGIPQTKRLLKSAHLFAHQNAIHSSAVLVLFLSPKGMRAQDTSVLSVSTNGFLQKLNGLLEHSSISANTARTIRSFIDFLAED
jgi:hypothetical protein